ncbi:metal ABC transporter permease [Candidatus Magnetaquicoccus inordinatus]|uniref:metal ABC transporter permease n=1 Tax=Candidatus Magnetaquicoccus inordinatus TaxID=2496818 RepID=UPI00102B9222|nr:metal ABC transporter permease [Candidatus Magnetaquicoccus inordinatus]
MTLYEFFIDPFAQFAFMRRALAACLALSLACGPVGIFLLLRRMSLMGDALSHALLPGVAVGFLIAGFSLPAMTIGGFIAGLGVVLLAGTAARFTLLREDASFAALQLISMALGVLIVSTKGGNVNLMHILFGSVLAVDDQALLITAAIASLSLLLLVFIYRPLIIDSFDPGYLQRSGSSGMRWQLLFLATVAMDLVAGFQAMGAMMAVGIMMLPAIAARFWAKEIWSLMATSIVLALGSGVFGLLFSFHYRLPSGPAIILTAGMLHLFSMMFAPLGIVRSRLLRHGRHRKG